MTKYKRHPLKALLFIFILSGCIRKPTQRDVSARLKSTMNLFLNSPKRTDTANAKFTVLSVTFYEEKTAYECEFKVHLKNISTDTIGTMGAVISKDFSQVKRKY
jgi:hypothetical protein